MKDNQYKLLKIVCEESDGFSPVTYSQVEKRWGKDCPPKNVLINLSGGLYLQVGIEHGQTTFFPNPEAYSYVRQCKDSIRNLIVTSATLFVAVWTFLATLYSVIQMTFQK